jgi:hypothetical protein
MEVLRVACLRTRACSVGSVLWPPRKPDFTQIGLLFWSYVKNLVYLEEIPDVNNLKARIREAADQVARDMLKWCTARSGTSTGQAQGHYRCISRDLVIAFETAIGIIQNKILSLKYGSHF